MSETEFPNEKFTFKKDRYSKARGGASKFLFVACGACTTPLFIYQKDGPGALIRYYADRIVWPPDLIDYSPDTAKIGEIGALACGSCDNLIAVPMIYKPENRLAFRAITGAAHNFRSAARAAARLEE